MTGGQDATLSQPVTAIWPSLVLIADDLTGAGDAAVAFTSACGPVRLQILGQANQTSGVRAITTESRDLPAHEAELRLRDAIEQLPEDTQLFKKIDSVFRGNTAIEITVALRCARFDLAILTPAYPALGRTVSGGLLDIHEATGTRTIPIAELLRQTGCSVASIPADQSFEALADSLRCHAQVGQAAVLCDASTQLDMIRIVRAARSLNKRILWIGSGGLAHALAADLPAQTPPPGPQVRSGATIFFIGSTHAVTRAQADHLRQIGGIAEHNPQTPRTSADDLLVTVNLGETTPDDIRRAAALHDPAQTSCLFMTGGDTAHFVCRALGIRSLRVLHEFAPGVSVAIAEGGAFDGVRVVLKSGGFGDVDLLYRLLERNRATIEVSA